MQHLVVTFIPFPHGLAAFEDRTRASSLASDPTHVVLVIVYEAEDYRDDDGPADFTPRRNGNTVFVSRRFPTTMNTSTHISGVVYILRQLVRSFQSN